MNDGVKILHAAAMVGQHGAMRTSNALKLCFLFIAVDKFKYELRLF